VGPLEPDTIYLWSARVRQGESVSDCAKIDIIVVYRKSWSSYLWL